MNKQDKSSLMALKFEGTRPVREYSTFST